MMNKLKHNQTIFWLLLTIQALGSLISIFSIPTDPKNAIFMGYSLARIVLILMMGLVFFFSLRLMISAWHQNKLSTSFFNWLNQHQKNLRIPLGLITIVLGLMLLVSPDQLWNFRFYIRRIQPVVVWGFTFFLLTCAWIAFQHGTGKELIEKNRTTWTNNKKIFFFLLILFALLWFIISGLGLGTINDIFWNEGSVPLLALQIWLTIFSGIIFAFLQLRFKNKTRNPIRSRRFDITVVFLLWAITGILWSVQPILRHTMVTMPDAPTYEYYSYSDGAKYDAGARYLRLGQGINNLKTTDKPGYIFFLGIIQILVGTEYTSVIFVQTLVLSFLPALLYLIGGLLHGRIAGFMAALLGMMLGVNTIQSNLNIQVTHSKLLMTELPTALMLALITWGFLRFQLVKSNHKNTRWLLSIIGGLCAIAGFMRPNAYVVIPVLILYLFLTENTWKTGAFNSLFLLIGFALVSLPWFIGAPSGLSVLPKYDTIIDKRYDSNTSETIEQPTAYMELLEETEHNSLIDNQLFIVSNHFLHNLSGASLVFYNRVPFVDLDTLTNSPPWETDWKGDLPFISALFFAGNLVLLVFGISYNTQKHKSVHWFAMIIFLAYHLSNAIVRNSGSRYLVPVEWVMILYFAIGLAQLIEWGGKWWLKLDWSIQTPQIKSDTTNNQTSKFILPVTLLVLVLLGLSMPLSDILVKDQLSYSATPETWSYLKTQNLPDALSKAGLDIDQVEEQIANNDEILIYHGMTMNPRFLIPGQAIVPTYDLYQPMPFPRLIFWGIGQYTAIITFPIPEAPENFYDDSEFFVIGCADPDMVEWRIRSNNSETLPVEGKFVFYGEERDWNLLVSSDLDETSLCP